MILTPYNLHKTCLRLIFAGLMMWSFAMPHMNAHADLLVEEGDLNKGGFSGAVSESCENFDEVVSKLAETLVAQGALEGQFVLISANDLYESTSRLSLPMALQLRGKLITEMKKRGCRVLLPGADTGNAVILQGTWFKQGQYLQIDLKVMKLGASGPEAIASASQKIPLSKIDPKTLVPDRESWARYLVRKLETNAMNPARRTLHMPDFQVKGKQCSPDLGNYLAGWMRPALAESRIFLPLEQQRALKDLSVQKIRSRGTRAFHPVTKNPAEASSLTADLLKADGEMKGTAWLNKENIEVRIVVVDRQGQQFTAASADVPSDLFPNYLLMPPSEPESPHGDPLPKTSGGLSKDGLHVELTTTRGEAKPFFRNGEHIKFVIRLNRTAYLYLFDLDPKGNAILLYPVDENGRLAREGRCGVMPQPDIPVILPEDGCSYDLVVTEPYGTDRVWVVASESPMDFPSDLGGEWAKADVLINRIRNQGLSGTGGYAEGQVEVVTGP